jgi:hypothetical protein
MTESNPRRQPRNRKLPSLEVIKALLAEGLSYREIGVRYGCSGEAVRQFSVRHGIAPPSTKTHHKQYMPWVLNLNHAGDFIALCLRAYSKSKQGVKLSDREARDLPAFVAYLDGANPQGIPLSVHYDRLDSEGWWLEPRQPGDHDYIHPPVSV